jgi:hypothetical protein
MEDKQGFFGRILNLIWKMVMSGKSKGLIAMYDHDPQVAAAIEKLEKSRSSLQKAIADSKKLRDKYKIY